jgi:hypothetical protein
MTSLLLLPLLVSLNSGLQVPAGKTATADSIYALAVKPGDHPDEPFVWLLDEGTYRIEPDGRTRNTTRKVVQILKPEAVRMHQEQRLSWNPERQTLTVNWMRVVKPNGEVIAEHPEQVQDSDVPAAMGTPMYTAYKVKRISLSGLEPGTLLDYSITTETSRPPVEGDFILGWNVNSGIHIVRSSLVVDLPAGYRPRITERNLTFKRREQAVGGRRLYSWATRDVPRIRTESYAPDSLFPRMAITVSPSTTWAAIGKGYAPLVRDAWGITPLVAEKITAELKGARTLDDSISALHRWVAQDIRYVSIALGQGGYVPRTPEAVVRTGYGDCKDKTMLFLAALRKIGVTGYPVLLNINGTEQKESPSLLQFNHMIAAVKRGSGYQYADLTAGTYPLGRLPRSEEGNVAVIVKEDDGEEVRLPESPAAADGIDTNITGTLNEDGYFSGTFEEVRTGHLEGTLHMLLQTSLDSTRRRNLFSMMASPYLERPEADSVESIDGRNLNAPVRTKMRITRAKLVSKAGDVMLMSNPARPLPYGRTAEGLEREKDRKLPYQTDKILAPHTTRVDFRVKLPSGWTAVLPKDQLVDAPIGRYEVKFSQVGDELRILRTLSGRQNVIPASRKAELIGWLRQLATEDARQIVLKTP